jgi:hypothetical protein
VLRFYQDRSFIQIAETLGITEIAARKRVSRGTEKLRRRFATERSYMARPDNAAPWNDPVQVSSEPGCPRAASQDAPNGWHPTLPRIPSCQRTRSWYPPPRPHCPAPLR